MRLAVIISLLLNSRMIQSQVYPFYSAENDKYGYKDSSGKIVITPRYDLAW